MTLDEKIAQLGAVEPIENLGFSEETFMSRIEHGTGQISMIGGHSMLGPAAIARLANEIQTRLVENTRLCIPVMVHEECCAGYMARGATCFPQIIGVAST